MSWMEKAACRRMGLDLFFARRTSAEGEEAVSICAGCPVSRECLDACLARERIRIGIFGGLGPYEREDLVRGDREDL